MDPRTARIPIVLCTGAVKEVEALGTHLAEMGVRIVRKPFNIDQLTATIAEALAERAQGEGSPPMTDNAVPGRRAETGAMVLPENLTNDLRTLLTIVSGRVQLARRRLRDSEVELGRVDADLETAEAAIERLVVRLRRLDGAPPADG